MINKPNEATPAGGTVAARADGRLHCAQPATPLLEWPVPPYRFPQSEWRVKVNDPQSGPALMSQYLGERYAQDLLAMKIEYQSETLNTTFAGHICIDDLRNLRDDIDLVLRYVDQLEDNYYNDDE